MAYCQGSQEAPLRNKAKRLGVGAQEVGKENLFIFGMDESEVPAWREGKRAAWKDYDPRFVKAIDMIKSGTFGDEEYFQVGQTWTWQGESKSMSVSWRGGNAPPEIVLQGEKVASCKSARTCT